jgi:hypothetical protein
VEDWQQRTFATAKRAARRRAWLKYEYFKSWLNSKRLIFHFSAQVEENPEGEQKDGENEGDTDNKEGAEGEKTAEEGGENNNTNVTSEGQTEPLNTNNNNVPVKPEVNMDELIEKSFFQAIKKRLKDKDLPILASTFYSKYLLPSRPAGTEIDIKKSCYKQVRTIMVKDIAYYELIN